MDNFEHDAATEAKTTKQVRRLWNAWLAGQRDALALLLHEQPHLRADQVALADLVYSEYWLRRQLDESVTEAEYFERFPEIADVLRDQFAVGAQLLTDNIERSVSPEDLLPPAPKDLYPGAPTVLAAGNDSTAAQSDVTVPLHESLTPYGFEPLCVLGVGGMGVVVKALQLSLNREVAIKSLKAGAWVSSTVRERLLKEAHVVAQLKHPHVVQIYDVIEERGKLFLVMEFVPGKSLAHYIARKPVEPRQSASFTRDIAAAIEAAHTAGFLHRDIKPTNVLLTAANEIKVTDFGLARATEQSAMSLSGELLGTPAYMAPEQVLGKRDTIDIRSDVYGIGATLYELLTGRPPFVGSSTAETLQQVLHADPQPPRALVAKVPSDLNSVCLRCLEKSPDNRYASASELLADLERFLNGIPTLARPVRFFERARRWVYRNPIPFFSTLALAVSLIALVITSTWYLTRVAYLESVGKTRDAAFGEVMAREQLNTYFSLASVIQTRVSEREFGWTWKNQSDIRQALKLVPTEAERVRLRQLLIQTLDGFDLRQNAVVATDIDPYGVAWSPDGERLVVGENVTRTLENGDEAYVLYVFGKWPERKLHEVLLPALEPERIAAGLVEGIRALQFLDNGQLVIGCRSGWIQILDLDSGQVTDKWRAHQDWCYGLTFVPARDWIISGSRDGTVSIWNAKTHQLIKELKASGSVKCLAVVGETLIALGSEHDQFSLSDFTKTQIFDGPDTDFSLLRPLEDRKSLVLASSSRIAVQDIFSNHLVNFAINRTPFTRAPYLSHIDSHHAEDWLAVTGIENALFLDARSRKEVMSLPLPGAGANYVVFDRQGAALWIANNYRLLRYDLHIPELWTSTRKTIQNSFVDPTTSRRIILTGLFSEHDICIHVENAIESKQEFWGRIEQTNIPSNSTAIEQQFVALDGKLQNSSAEVLPKLNNHMAIWDASKAQLKPSEIPFGAADLAQANIISLSADAQHLWIGDTVDKVGRLRVKRVSDGAVIYESLNTESAKRIRVGGYEDLVCGNLWTLALSNDHKLSVFDSHSCAFAYSIDLGNDTIPKVAALDSNETIAFIGAQEGHLLAIDLATRQVRQVTQSTSEITALAASAFGMLAIGFHSGDIELWSLDTQPAARLCKLPRMSNSINLLEFSGDGNQLALWVQGETAGRLLDWNALRARLREFDLDWTTERFPISPTPQR